MEISGNRYQVNEVRLLFYQLISAVVYTTDYKVDLFCSDLVADV